MSWLHLGYELRIFDEQLRGLALGHTKWDLTAESVMTHGWVDDLEVRVLSIKKAARVRVRSIEILRGSNPSGGGISNKGRLTLHDVVVRKNAAYRGGGILNQGTLTLVEVSIQGNAASGGAGVDNEGTLTMNGNSAISGNHGAGVMNSLGSITMNDASSIHGNPFGGVGNFGTLTMNDGRVDIGLLLDGRVLGGDDV